MTRMKHTDRFATYNVRIRSVECDVCGRSPVFDKLSIEPDGSVAPNKYFADKSGVIPPGWVSNGQKAICLSCLEISQKVAAIRKAADAEGAATQEKENE